MRDVVPLDAGSHSYAVVGYANPHAVTSVGGTTYTYGNVTAIGSLDYAWDWRNRLASAERSGGGITSYGYDHTGQRVFQATGSATTSYPNRYYNVASSTLTATTTKHIFSPNGTLLATIVGSGTSTASTTYLHPDHLGGTNVATDADGEVVQTLDYYPYGAQRIATGSFDEQRRFIGEEFDGDTEFLYLNARYYQGSRGQFMSQDPVFVNLGADRRTKLLLADPQLQNAYAYSRNNPVAFRDPSGEFLIVPVVLTLALAGQLSYLYSTHKVVQTLNSPTATPEEKDAAAQRFFANMAINGALLMTGLASSEGLGSAGSIVDEGLPLLLDGMDFVYGDELYKDLNKRRNEQTRHQASVTVKGPSNSNGSGGGGTYAYPAPSRNPIESGRSSGGNFVGLSGGQQSALQSFTSAINAQNFDAQAFVSSLQAIIKAFDLSN